ncbi:MAG: DNA-protecting protein DprA [Acidimicrobiia bacterium]|nr:DNA-protecting protein DprA [Acidimicrobiia bacterium]
MSADALRLAWSRIPPDRLARLVQSAGGADAVVQHLRSGDGDDDVRRVLETPVGELRQRLDRLAVSFVTSEGFPTALRDVEVPPAHLFVRGAPLADRAAVSVVGSRSATAYGLRVARRLGSVLAGAGIAVVSGLARGIDGAAHAGALDAGGVTWAVLGCGIDRWYPASHADLGRRILTESGCVVSEFPPGVPPAPWRFPMRNRIIAGLATAVVVVEAASTGGALITARLALEQGRTVFAVPGDIDRATSEGCNRLIADGAIPLTSEADLLEGIGFLRATEAAPAPVEGIDAVSPLGSAPEEVGAALGLDGEALRAQLARWEVAGIVARRGGLIIRL